MIFVKQVGQQFFSPLSFDAVFGSGIRDPGSGINIPDQQHWLWIGIVLKPSLIQISIICRSRSGSGLVSKRCRSTCGSYPQVLHMLENTKKKFFFSQQCQFTMFSLSEPAKWCGSDPIRIHNNVPNQCWDSLRIVERTRWETKQSMKKVWEVRTVVEGQIIIRKHSGSGSDQIRNYIPYLAWSPVVGTGSGMIQFRSREASPRITICICCHPWQWARRCWDQTAWSTWGSVCSSQGIRSSVPGWNAWKPGGLQEEK